MNDVRIAIVLLFILAFISCSDDDQKRFHLVSSQHSGIEFRNTLKETVDFNIFNYMYFYNGGGVAVGDVNGDDLLDVFFTSNQETDKLYLNLGNLKFKDITEASGTGGGRNWTTGVTMADVNGDGRLDIYVSSVGNYLTSKGANQLFINEGNDANGIPVFNDRAEEYGLALVGFSTQAAFFDYDRDGDLDMFMLNHSLHQQGTFGRSSLRTTTHELAGDKLMKNENGKFVDVTTSSGIFSSVLGYGLGVVVSDVNMDGFPDLYIGNDFHENDYLYINQGNGTFEEVVQISMQHTSRYTMGVDFADVNNDGFPDLISMDMLPSDPVILKSSMAEDPYDVYNFKLKFGYNHQFARNTFQLNNRNGTFSEVALQANVAATDWSWATFFADFDLDGRKDIFVANGIARRSNDLDYINFIEVDSIQGKISGDINERELQFFRKMPQIKIPNALFFNNGDTTFSNKAIAWGLDRPSYSNGAAYGDLDNDGDLDLIINNIDDEAMLYENRSANDPDERNNFLQVRLKGHGQNKFGLGTKVLVFVNGQKQMQECMPTRGYQSAVDYRLTFGLGKRTSIDSLWIIWNNGEFQRLYNISVNKTITLDQQDASGIFDYSSFISGRPLFSKVEGFRLSNFLHRENQFLEFNREQLIPHMMSTLGPACAVADIDNDGKEDVFFGGAKRQSAVMFKQNMDGDFDRLEQRVISADSVFEDVDAEFFDADSDGDQDLFVLSGGNEYYGKSGFMSPRLYINDGSGNFSRSDNLPVLFLSGACIAIADMDADGDKDIFLGARTTTGQYGVRPDSYLLVNDGKGGFMDATDRDAPGLKNFAFVRDAIWADIDNDKDLDLVIAAEWSSITILRNEGGRLTTLTDERTKLGGSKGWWSALAAADFDNDGDLDFIAGNLGLNSKLKASGKFPVNMYVSDFDGNGNIEQVLSHFVNGVEYPFHTRDELTKQMPFLKKRYLSYHKFAAAKLQDIFTKEQLKQATGFSANTFQSCYIENLGKGTFQTRPLPNSAQFSTVDAILVDDFNNDGQQDVLIAGNCFAVNVQRGRYDASYGLLLSGDGKGNFKVIPPDESGFSVPGETRYLKTVKVAGNSYYIAVRNNDSVKVFTVKK